VKINSDINVLGSLPDWNLTKVFLTEDMQSIKEKGGIHAYTAIKTDKSVKRFEKAIKATLIQNKNPGLEVIIRQAIKSNTTSVETQLLLFWNASANNELLFQKSPILFPAIGFPIRSAKSKLFSTGYCKKNFQNILMWFIQATSSVLNH
jgi:hypothetical protein